MRKTPPGIAVGERRLLGHARDGSLLLGALEEQFIFGFFPGARRSAQRQVGDMRRRGIMQASGIGYPRAMNRPQ